MTSLENKENDKKNMKSLEKENENEIKSLEKKENEIRKKKIFRK